MDDKFPDDPLEALNFSIDDDDFNFSSLKTQDKGRAATLFGSSGDSQKTIESAPPIQELAGYIPRKRGSGDWLGLKDQSPLDILNDDLVKPQTAKPLDVLKETTIRAKTAEPAGKTNFTPKTTGRKRLNILDDLFGDTSLSKDKDKPKTPMSAPGGDKKQPLTQQSEKKEEALSYLPTVADRRSFTDKKNSVKKILDSDDDWLLGLKESKEKVKEGPKPHSTSTLTLPKRSASKDSGNGLPSWLSSGFNESPVQPETPFLVSTDTAVQPDLPNESGVPTSVHNQTARKEATKETNVQNLTEQIGANVQQHHQLLNTATNQQGAYAFNPPSAMGFPSQIILPPFNFSANPLYTELIDSSVIDQMTRIHAQLGAAMAKHQQNLFTYMQAILFEAQRVGLKMSSPNREENESDDDSHDQLIEEDDSEKVESKEPKKKRARLKRRIKDPKEEKIRDQDLLIQEMEIQIAKLELQVVQLDLKIANIEEVKNLEIESLKKMQGFEITGWENRYERAKQNFDEIAKEYEEKIDRLKIKIKDMEEQHKERIEALQNERMIDIEKLGEFHKVALEQAASITLPQVSSYSGIRLPMKLVQKPQDNDELNERGLALVEKEKQLEILRHTLEIEKGELDEIKGKEKVDKEERERDLRRKALEVQLKEEMLIKDHDRKKDQLEALQSQLQKMRDDALKEQAELTKEKLGLATEKAKLDAAMSLERTSESPQLQPLDMLQARAELEAALAAAKEAREAADKERRRHVELRKTVEETAWDQKDKEQQLEMRERHISNMLKEADCKQAEASATLDKVETLNEEIDNKRREIREQLRQIETKEKVLATERMEVARERIELEKKKSQLEILLPELNPSEDLVVQGGGRVDSLNKDFIDPKALIMRLKAERDLQHYVAPIRRQSKRL